MKLRRRFSLAMAAAAMGTVGVIGIAACSPGAAATLSPEASALSALGFTSSDVTLASDPSTPPSGSGGASAAPGVHHPRWQALRIHRFLRHNVEHGEVVVQTRNGNQTIEVQRGKVTAISSTSMTVQSVDGFTETWTFGSPIHVIEHRTTVQPSNVVVGDQVGVAGTKTGDTTTAKLIVIPNG